MGVIDNPLRNFQVTLKSPNSDVQYPICYENAYEGGFNWRFFFIDVGHEVSVYRRLINKESQLYHLRNKKQ